MTIPLIYSSCAKSPGAESFDSVQSLAKRIVENMNKADYKRIQSLFVTKDFFLKEIYPLTEEANTKGALSPEDFWRIHAYGLKRNYSAKVFSERYKNYHISIDKILPPEKIIKLDEWKLLKKSHVLLKLEDKKNKSKVEFELEKGLLGILIEKDNKYYLLNMFK